MAKNIVLNQPFDSLQDFVTRARPNRGMVVSLAEARALDCFAEVKKIRSTEEIMEFYDSLVEERNRLEKEQKKESKAKYKVKSPMLMQKKNKTDNLINF